MCEFVLARAWTRRNCGAGLSLPAQRCTAMFQRTPSSGWDFGSRHRLGRVEISLRDSRGSHSDEQTTAKPAWNRKGHEASDESSDACDIGCNDDCDVH